MWIIIDVRCWRGRQYGDWINAVIKILENISGWVVKLKDLEYDKNKGLSPFTFKKTKL